jgi:hypothetical protein
MGIDGDRTFGPRIYDELRGGYLSRVKLRRSL